MVVVKGSREVENFLAMLTHNYFAFRKIDFFKL